MSTPATNHRHPPAALCGLLALTSAALLAWTTAGATAQPACGCAAPAPADALARSTAVFEGTVLGAEAQEGVTRIRFSVTRTWRGPEREQLEVQTAGGCGLSVAQGAAYLVYATGAADALQSDRCGGTKPMAEADPDLRVIGIGAVPVDPPKKADEGAQPEPPARGGCASCRIGTATQGHPPALAATMSLFVALAWRRRNKRG